MCFIVLMMPNSNFEKVSSHHNEEKMMEKRNYDFFNSRSDDICQHAPTAVQ